MSPFRTHRPSASHLVPEPEFADETQARSSRRRRPSRRPARLHRRPPPPRRPRPPAAPAAGAGSQGPARSQQVRRRRRRAHLHLHQLRLRRGGAGRRGTAAAGGGPRTSACTRRGAPRRRRCGAGRRCRTARACSSSAASGSATAATVPCTASPEGSMPPPPRRRPLNGVVLVPLLLWDVAGTPRRPAPYPVRPHAPRDLWAVLGCPTVHPAGTAQAAVPTIRGPPSCAAAGRPTAWPSSLPLRARATVELLYGFHGGGVKMEKTG